MLADAPPAEFPFIDNPIVGADFWTARLTAIKAIAHYLWLTVWPATLSSDYSYAQIPLARGTPEDWAAWIAVLAAVILAVLLYRWNRMAFFWVCFAALTFAPMSNLLFPVGTIMAERFLYVPAIGLLACVVMGIYATGERLGSKKFAPLALGLIVTAFAMRTWVRNRDWQNELSMAQASVSSSPNSFKTHRLPAYILSQQPTAPNLDRALQEVEKSVAILDTLPDSRNTPEVYQMAGAYYLAKGDAHHDSPESATEYQKALKFLLHSRGIYRITREAYERNRAAEWTRSHPAAQLIDDADPETQWMPAEVYARLNNLEKASTEAAKALELHPAAPEAYRTISSIFAAEDRKNDAAIALLEGMLITPDFQLLMPDLVVLYHDLYGANTCAIAQGPNGPTLNPRCEMVRAQFCFAAVEALKAAVQTARWDVARDQKQKFVQGGCPADPLDKVFPGS